MPAATLQNLLTENRGFVYLARTVDDATAAKVAHARPGRHLQPEGTEALLPRRSARPTRCSASVGTDNNGLGGLEYKYNSILAGQAGESVTQIDPNGREVPGGRQVYRAPVAGQDLVLSIDEPLQYETEQALAQAIVAAKAKTGIALLMNSKTGEILADAELTMPGPGNKRAAGRAGQRRHGPGAAGCGPAIGLRSKRRRQPRSPTSTSRARSTS